MPKPCICIVTETYRPEINGVSNTLGYWVDGLIQRGICVQVVRPKQHPSDKHTKTAREHQYTVTGLPIPGYAELKFGLPAGRFLKKLWRQNPPDSVYVATEGPLGLSAVRAAEKLAIPVVSGFHTNFQSYSRYYKLGWLEPFIFAFLRYFHNRTRATLVPTGKQARWLQHNGFRDVSVLSRGIDTARFNPHNRDKTERAAWLNTNVSETTQSETPICLYVGRLASEKNVDLLEHTYRTLKPDFPTLKFVLVGDGPRRKQLQENNPDWIFTGMKTGKELAKHYASADIFLFPSKTDTFGNVVTEAMASRLAIIAFDDAAAREHLQHGKSALLAPLSDEVGFTDNLRQALKRPELVEELRSQALVKARQLSWDQIVDQFMETLLGPGTQSLRGGGYYEPAKNVDIL